MKNVLITGSSHGIGAAAAVAFAKEGYHVGVNGASNKDKAVAVADECMKYGVKGSIINVSSIHSRGTWVHRRMLPYSAGKGGLNMFTRALGVEVIKYGTEGA